MTGRVRRVAAVGAGVALAGVALYVAAVAGTVALWASLWAVSGWVR